MRILEENQCVLDVNTDTIMACFFNPELVGNDGMKLIGVRGWEEGGKTMS